MGSALLTAVIDAEQDFEWYPTTQRMIDVVARHIPQDAGSLMDIGAGDGRVLESLGKRRERVSLYAIEKSTVLAQAWPESIIPLGTDLFEQNLSCLPVDYIFCNPPYSQYEAWASAIIESGYAKKAFLVIPRRWSDSRLIADSLKKRGATPRVIHSDDFSDAERRARAVIDIVEVSYPRKHDSYTNEVQDPFDIWFDQNIDTFDREPELSEDDQASRDMARVRGMESIGELVDAYNEEHARMEANYRAIFKLDHALLKELGVEKNAVREGIKKKMAGLKTKYWQLLFNRLDTITNRLSTATKRKFLEKLTGRTAIAFTSGNAYTVILWAIKNANKYYDEQLVTLFRDLSTFDGVMNYKSNQRTWKKDGWRYLSNPHREEERPTHYALDYRIVLEKHQAIPNADRFGYVSSFENPGNLHKNCHELIADITAVLYNLGFSTPDPSSLIRSWESGQWQDWTTSAGDVLFQVKAFKNGNMHLRFKPDAIRALNVEAGRLLGWLRGREDVVSQLGYAPEDAERYFRSSLQLGPSSVKLLGLAKGAA